MTARRTMWAMSSASAPASAAGLAGGQRDAIIHTEDLTKVYAGTDFAAVDSLDLERRRGQILDCSGPTAPAKPPPPEC